MGVLLAFPRDRGNRPRDVRATTEPVRAQKVRLRIVAEDGIAVERPKTRGDCVDGVRPCPWVGCRHHLALDVERNGSIKHNFPDLEPDELEHSCSLDVADDGGVTLDDVGGLLNLTRERIRQLGDKAIARVRKRADILAEFVDEDPEKLEKRGPMGHGGRLGDSARVVQRLTETDDERDEPAAYVSSKVWPPDPRDLRDEHDALAADRIWSAYLRDSHSNGITPDEFSKKRKDTGTMGVSEERRDAIVAAVKGGAHKLGDIAKELGITKGAATMSVRGAIAEGVIVGVGNRQSRCFYMPGSVPEADSRTTLEAVASKPRTKKVTRTVTTPAMVITKKKASAPLADDDVIARLFSKREQLLHQVDAITAAIEALS